MNSAYNSRKENSRRSFYKFKKGNEKCFKSVPLALLRQFEEDMTKRELRSFFNEKRVGSNPPPKKLGNTTDDYCCPLCWPGNLQRRLFEKGENRMIIQHYTKR